MKSPYLLLLIWFMLAIVVTPCSAIQNQSQLLILQNLTGPTPDVISHLNKSIGDGIFEYSFILVLDKGNVTHTLLNSIGTEGSVNINISTIAENVTRCNASSITLIHNHPNCICSFSKQDTIAVMALGEYLSQFNVTVQNDIVFCCNGNTTRKAPHW